MKQEQNTNSTTDKEGKWVKPDFQGIENTIDQNITALELLKQSLVKMKQDIILSQNRAKRNND